MSFYPEDEEELSSEPHSGGRGLGDRIKQAGSDGSSKLRSSVSGLFGGRGGADDDGPETVRTRPAPRRAPRQRASKDPGVDHQTLLVRRAIAAGIALVVLILIVLGVNSCLSSRAERELKDYNRSVSALARDSESQVSKPFFQALTDSGNTSPIDLETQVNGLAASAADIARRGNNLSAPDEMGKAQSNLETVLQLRSDGMKAIAQKLPTALGRRGAEEAVNSIAAQMQAFLASDVDYSQIVIPAIGSTLEKSGVGGQTIAESQFLPSLEWLDPAFVGETIGANTTAGGKKGAVAPGLHGTGIISTSVGDTELSPDDVNRIPASADVGFNIVFANQGENDEFDIPVTVTVTGAGKPIVARKTVDVIRTGEEATVSIPLGQAPPVDQSVTVQVDVKTVPGEEEGDNNKQEYPAIFTG